MALTLDLLDFSNVDDSGLDTGTPAFNALTATGQTTGTPTRAFRTFRAVARGTFSVDPLPTVTAAVREPATWMMLLFGFLGIGIGLRGRNKRAAPVVA